jgi:predicted AAA+ superfamily ATPase
MYIQRAIEDTVLRFSKQFRVVLVTGPRQCGKTTMLKHLAEEGREYVTLDDPNQRLAARSDPAWFVETHEPPMLIDEIQYAPEILPYIKMKVDADQAKGAYWLTGSQTFQTMKGVTESLAGRVGIVSMLGLSKNEILGLPSVPFDTEVERLRERARAIPAVEIRELFSLIHRGGMPELYADPGIETQAYHASYLKTYLERDIRDLTQVADEMTFLRFLTAAAARTAKPLKWEELARDAGISPHTARHWVSLLVTSGIVQLVPAYHNNVLKRTVKMPMLHFLDTALCAYLLKWPDSRTLENGAMAGQFFESWVFTEIVKSYLNAGLEAPIYYYRDTLKHEIDLLLHRNGTLYPVEIKKTASPGHKSIASFKQLTPVSEAVDERKTAIGTGAVLCMIDRPTPADRENWYIPAWLV